MYTVDSFAWIEYFQGSARGAKVRKIIDGDFRICTPSVVLFEIKKKILKEQKDWRKWVDFVTKRSTIEPLTAEIALDAADIKQEYNLGAMDSLIYATNSAKKTKLLTGDLHFRNLENVEFI